jgi:hypothetical protein
MEARTFGGVDPASEGYFFAIASGSVVDVIGREERKMNLWKIFLSYIQELAKHPEVLALERMFKAVEHEELHGDPGEYLEGLRREVRFLEDFDPGEPRDEGGRWTSGGGHAKAPEEEEESPRPKREKPDFSWIEDPVVRKAEEEAYKEALRIDKELAKNRKIRETELKVDDQFKSAKSTPKTKELLKKYRLLYSGGEIAKVPKLWIDPASEAGEATARKILALKKIPLGMHEQLDKFGTTMTLGDKRTNEYPPIDRLTGTPRGYEQGRTYDHVPAIYSSGGKTIVVGDPQGVPPEDCVLHELGHAVDHMYGWYSHPEKSRTKAVQKAWAEFNGKLSETERKYQYKYYVGQETEHANLEESFAESFKDYHKYGEAACTQKWGKGFSDIHASFAKQAQYNHDANEAEKAGILSNWPQHEKIQY